jgi:hypothetical protein
MRCADFLSTLGVDIHIEYADTRYDRVASVIAALDHCRIRLVRDGAISSLAPNADHYGALAAAGVSFCMLWGPRRPMADQIAQIDRFEAAHPGAVHAIEGPNEIKPDFAHDGLVGIPAAQRYMSELRARLAATRTLGRKPLVDLTSFGRFACDCDIANVHPYPKSAQPPGPLMRTVWRRWVGPDGVMPGKPLYFTEFGYHTLVEGPVKPGAWAGVDEETQAILLVDGWLSAAAARISRVYLYQLLDEVADLPGRPNLEHHFGLFRHDGTPKPAADAIRRLSLFLADPAPGAATFTTAAPQAKIELDPSLAALVLQNSRGETFVCLWSEARIWSAADAAPLAIGGARARIRMPRAARLHLLDIVSGEAPADLGRSATADLHVGPHPVALRVTDL